MIQICRRKCPDHIKVLPAKLHALKLDITMTVLEDDWFDFHCGTCDENTRNALEQLIDSLIIIF